MWVFAIADFGSNTVMINIVFYLPAIIQDFGVSTLMSNLLSSIPYGTAVFVMMWIAIHSDKVNERWLHVVVPCVAALIGLGLLALAIEANW
jgi:MFS transporter, ACS family, tartrate transporter